MSAILAYFLYQACFLWLVLAAGWTWSGFNRRRERLRRLTAAKAAAAAATSLTPPSRAGRASGRPCLGDRQSGSCGNGGTVTAESSARASNGVAAAMEDVPWSSHTPLERCWASSAAAATPSGGSPLEGEREGEREREAGGGRRHPPVSVVMPVKGCRPHSRINWESHLGLQYGGPLEFLFVVESEDDPAVGPLRELIRCCREGGRGRPAGVRGRGRCAGGGGQEEEEEEEEAVAVRLVVAGLAESCSQKAHNLCAGIESCDPRVGRERGYVLCLDDDVALHPGTLEEMVADLEARPGAFMATGYPFDVPPPGSSLPAHLAAAYHLPLLIAFSTCPDTSFVWGGCMLLRGEQLLPLPLRGKEQGEEGEGEGEGEERWRARGEAGGLLAAWRNGGYSDDLILASYCTERGLGIRVPPFAVFPQRLDPRMGWAAWLNYLHRQLFVLDTYTNDHNRRTNHTMMVLHSVLSWLLVLPSLAALYTLAARALSAAVAVVVATAATAAAEAATTAAGRGDGGAGGGDGGGGGGGGPAPPPASQSLSPLLSLPGGVVAVAVGWAAAHAALVFMTAEILALFRQLSPSSPAIPLEWFRWGRLWVALLASNAVLPLVMAYTYLSPTVEWGGVTYRKHRGEVTPVHRRRTTASRR
ncbi:hypothetical protein PLESTB_001665300 [Pleodorina starrii]|uniref:ceramide glucosyltransferase n=1 Tax=Pleodorina starrii TaxID=330485 RepID=A0A9W6F9K4_9CHLO|nr:hypothetical protein PLESTM_000629400 [Pleodorina starrii]GLC60736.1 hypothetical protein PLESTB_001665300 [Pleodorina starrii]GLC69897.1 hypothetical protein PLESTF_000893200 [Pleodorina starrii]